MLTRLCLAAAGLGLAAAPAAADLIVTVGSATVTPGGTTTVDVTITGTDPAEFAAFDFFVAAFTLTPVDGAPASGLAFADPQAGDFTTEADYVFRGRSGLLSRGVVGGVLTVGDYAADEAPDGFTGPKLLARLELTALATAAVGDKYTVELDLGQSEFQAGNDALTVSASSTLSGTVTVVPEPGVLALAGLGLVGSAAVRRLARRPTGAR